MLTKIESACANTILNYFFKENEFITHMKLQKLFYFSSGVHISNHDTYMAEHLFQAWENGPVLPGLYRELESHGEAYITESIKFQNTRFTYEEGPVFETITSVIKKIGHHTALELSEMSHAKEGPWYKTVSQKGYKEDIDTVLIRNYFQEYKIL